MNKVAIIGLGLMGGSLALAVKSSGKVKTVCGYARRDETRQKALAVGACDEAFDSPQEAVKDADVVVFCLPVLVMGELISKCASSLPDGCAVTDVGSTKSELENEVSGILESADVNFVGSHPICGSEKTGLEVATSDLYKGAVVVMTSDNQAIRDLWELVGAHVIIMDSKRHDEVIARTSHLPHVVAAALAEHVLGEGSDDVKSLCGSGFYDTTRVAGGSEIIWHDIVRTNRDALLAELEGFGELLSNIEKMVRDEDYEALHKFLQKARESRSALG